MAANDVGPRFRLNLLYILFAAWGALILQAWLSTSQVTRIPYSEFLERARTGEISEVVVTDNYISGHFKNPQENGKDEFLTARVEPELAKELEASGIKFTRMIENNWLSTVLSWVVPILLFFGLWLLVAKRMQSGLPGGFMSLGKNKARIYVETDTKTTFSDVAGIDEAKEELLEVVGFLKTPQDYGRLGARTPKGVLLVGPPGTGKTLLARAVAGEARVPFYSISGSEFVEMFVGLGAARVRDLFEQARAKAPCIIFIDELDALGKARNHPMASSHDEKEQTLNQLLVEMDGFDAMAGIVILAATNRPEMLDPALLRAGRFDRQVLVDRPDKKGRIEILKIHSKKIKLAPDVSLEQVAELTAGFTGADLANLCNEAAIIATRNKKESVSQSDFTAGFERIVAGLERKNRLLNEKEKCVVAHHEMGHALIASALPDCDPVHKISIIPRGVGALGYTLQRPTGDRFLMTEQELRNRMCVLLGGRAAEMLMFNHFSTGAADDLVKATDIARNMVTRYGMDKHIGSVSIESDSPGFLGNEPIPLTKDRQHSEETAREVDSAVRHLIEEELDRAIRIINQNKTLLTSGADKLLKQETLEADDLKDLFNQIDISDRDRGDDTSFKVIYVEHAPLKNRRALADLSRKDHYTESERPI